MEVYEVRFGFDESLLAVLSGVAGVGLIAAALFMSVRRASADLTRGIALIGIVLIGLAVAYILVMVWLTT